MLNPYYNLILLRRRGVPRDHEKHPMLTYLLKHDRQLRNLATKHLPYYLQNVPVDTEWPCYVPWARRSLAISSAHKIIMIHRKFLGLSFVNPVFEFTRKTC